VNDIKYTDKLEVKNKVTGEMLLELRLDNSLFTLKAKGGLSVSERQISLWTVSNVLTLLWAITMQSPKPCVSRSSTPLNIPLL
jgi:hypothetical protein